jgi:arylsulfatase A-like enzyme
LLPTFLAAADVPLPEDRLLDGINLLPWLTGQSELPDRPLFAMNGERIVSVQRGRFKLHVVGSRAAPLERHFDKPADWVDNRGPDGVTILAPVEQPRPDAFPGLRSGVAPRNGLLFDLDSDPGEQHDIAAEHPEIVRQLTADFQREAASLPAELRAANGMH